MGEEVWNNIKEYAKKAVKKAIKEAIMPYIPYILIGVAILFGLIIVIAIIYSFVSTDKVDTEYSVINELSYLNVYEVNISRSQFIKCVKQYRNDNAYNNNIVKYVESIYDICKKNGINPILCIAQAGQESEFGESVPINSPFNYWGIAVYNNSQEGMQFNSMDEALQAYCDVLLSYKNDSETLARSKEYAKVNTNFTRYFNNSL